MQHKGDCTMIGKITKSSMRLIADEIIYTVKYYGDDESKCKEKIQELLENEGIVEVIPD